MRWKLLFGGLALLLSTLGGCKQPVYLTVEDHEHYASIMPPDLENKPNFGAEPIIHQSPVPATVLDPDRKLRYLPLAEAIATALEQGNVGSRNLFFLIQGGNSPLSFGVAGGASSVGNDPYQEQDITFTGTGLTGSDGIRVLRLDPATVGAGIEQALSKFDAIWSSSANWNTTDRPVATASDLFSAGGAGSGITAINEQDVTVSTGIYKPLPTGGIAGITFSTAYTDTNLPTLVNPSYRPTLQFGFEQPLLQGFGTEINELRPTHPDQFSILNPGLFSQFNASPTPEGILVTRIRFDQQRADFEANVNFMVMNVEIAYWNLYNAYWSLYASEQAVRQAYEAWKISIAQFQAGRVDSSVLAQARGTYEQFRGNRLVTMATVLDAERSLRGMMGLPADDCTRLVPTDTPTITPYQPDWCTSWQECMANLPELALCREDVKANQMNVILQKNNLLPDLRFTATYDINSLGSQLDGSGSANAFGNLASDHFNNWAVGLRLNVPIGFRTAQSQLRVAQLRLARSYEFLKNTELKSERILALFYRRLVSEYELIKIRRSQREAFADQLKSKFQKFLAGQKDVTLDVLLEAQRQWADALAIEYQVIRDYNLVIVAFETARGTNLRRNNVIISEGALPVAAQKRAVEHERERDKAILLRERALAPAGIDEKPPPVQMEGVITPGHPPSIVNLWQADPPLKDAPELPLVNAIPGPKNSSVPVGYTVPAPQSGAPVVPAVLQSGPGKSEPLPILPAISTSTAPPVSMGQPDQTTKKTSSELQPLGDSQAPAATLMAPPPSLPKEP
jgi:outer membrane protein TolC